MTSDRIWTVEEANAAIEELRPRIERIRQARRALLATAEPIAERAAGNGGEEGGERFAATRVLRAELERLAEDGIVLRDAEGGLVDFPAERDGEPAFLCWRTDEDRVAYWHPPETGFAGRKPL